MNAGWVMKLWAQATGGPPIPPMAATLRLGSSSSSPLRLLDVWHNQDEDDGDNDRLICEQALADEVIGRTPANDC
jgi:hypothetical protein